MTVKTVDRDLGRAQALVQAAADGGCEAVASALGSSGDGDVVALVSELEVLSRRVGALQLAVMDEIDRRNLHEADGHPSPKVMVRHLGQLSGTEAAGRERARQALALLAELRQAYVAGEVGTDQVRLLGRVHANPRIRDRLAERDATFVRQARRSSYPEFESSVRQWERIVDRDGSEAASEQAHDRRDFSLRHDPIGLGWDIRGSGGSLAGAAMDEIFHRYVQAEWETDWDKARAEHGEAATTGDLPRTDAQRRFDALWAIFQDAASTAPGSNPPRFVHNIVWDAESYQQLLGELDGGPTATLDPEQFRCQTIDGVALAPTETLYNSLVSHVRRVMVDAAGTVIDLGTARRFTGSARLAAQLAGNTCRWKGCRVPVSACEIDHIHPHSRGGSTNPGNGDPLCGRHNRWKQKGFTVWRDPSGEWHTYRPDGTEIP